MLKFWTSAEYAYLKRIADPVLCQMRRRPTVEAIEFLPYDLQVPEEGEVHLAMGTKCVEVLQEARVLPRNLSIAKLRGKLFPAGEGKGGWMVTYDPHLVEREAKATTDIQWDVRLACRYLTTGTLKPKLGTYRWVEDFQELIDKIKRTADETGGKCRVFEDLETLGLWPWYDHAWIISIAFCAEPGTADIALFPKLGDMPSDRLLRQIEWIENADEVSEAGANLKYDNVWKRKKWGLPHPTSFTTDTLLIGSLVNENRSNSLNTHVKIYTEMGGYDDDFNATHDKGRMDLALAQDPESFKNYAGGDVDGGARARPEIVAELAEDPDLVDFYTTILHPASRAFEKIEYVGMLVDEAELRKVGKLCEVEARKAMSEMYSLTPVWVKRKRSGATGDKLKFTPAVLREIFFDKRLGWGLTPKVKTEKAPKDGLETDPLKYASTSVDDHLKMFKNHPKAGPFLDALKRKNKADKINSSYVKGFLTHLRPDGRFHPTFALHVGSQYEDRDQEDQGAKTGRTSAKNPHAQTLPKRVKPGERDWPKLLRSCYPAPEGKLIGELDYDQGELKICAMLAQEPTMLQLFRDGMDMHLMTGAQMAKMSYEAAAALEETDPKKFKFLRYGSKAINFGKIFKQGPRGFVDYAYRQWDLEYTLAESERIHDVFFKTYGHLQGYHHRQIRMAKELGYTKNPFGRVRHLPLINSKDRKTANKAMRQSVNSDIQSTLSDMGLWSIGLADGAGLLDQGLEIFLFVHDAVLFYFEPTEHGWGLVRQLKEIMENLPYEKLADPETGEFWEPELKMTTSLEVGPDLGALESYDLAA